ncbi:GDP-L-fucose synthase [bacterium]|nr:GDP-L-fucose synthase [bacterium]
MDIKEKVVLVTGASGFLGTHVMNELKNHGLSTEEDTNAANLFASARSDEKDLTKFNDVKEIYAQLRPDIVIHLAAVVGGIAANQDNPGKYFYDNMQMTLNMIEMARKYETEKFVGIGTICAYPKHTPVPFKESDLWAGYPEETNAPYGLAKKMMLVMSQAYRQQYGCNMIYLLPVNLYGPGDNFDLHSSHVIPAIIRKCIDAIDNEDSSITCWGTGKATREFLYAPDAADAIVQATLHYDGPEPINIGSGMEISIKDLTNLIADLCGFKGKIKWDSSKPNGQPRRCLDTKQAKRQFGWTARTKLADGLTETIKWYKDNKEDIIASEVNAI